MYKLVVSDVQQIDMSKINADFSFLATCLFLSVLHARLEVMFTSLDLWSVIPPRNRTVSMRALAWRGISRQGCVFWQNLVSIHRAFPLQMFHESLQRP